MATAPSTPEKDNMLAHVYRKFRDWESIGREVSERSKEASDQSILEPHTEHRKTVHEPTYPWTSNECRVLAALSDSKTPQAEFPLYLPDRTYEACFRKYQLQKILGIGQGTNHGVNTPRWTALEGQKLVEQKRANKSWKEISKALNGPYSQAECRTQWINHFWEDFNMSFVNGELDVERYKWMIKTRRGIEAHDDDVNAEG